MRICDQSVSFDVVYLTQDLSALALQNFSAEAKGIVEIWSGKRGSEAELPKDKNLGMFGFFCLKGGTTMKQ